MTGLTTPGGTGSPEEKPEKDMWGMNKMALPLQHAPEPAWVDIWTGVRDRIRLELGQGIFDTWIAPLSLTSVEGGHVRLAAPSRLIRDYVASHHATRVERALVAAAPAFTSLEIAVTAPEARGLGVQPKPAPARMAQRAGAAHLPLPDLAGAKGAGVSLQGLWDRQPDPAQSFAGFVVGPSNEFAFKAAQRLAESGEPDMGLLFIHGGFGNGKTHLLNAIALEARSTRGARVLFLRAEDFMRRFLAALRNQETLAFKEELRGADILLIDDLQHICGRSTMNEFLHTVNAFTDLRRKVVIAADRSPATLDGIADDIRSRLQGAVVIALEKPDAPTRLAILRAKAVEMAKKWPRAAIPDSMLEQVANELDASPRELLGVLMKLATYADLTGKPVTPEMTEEAIGSRIVNGDRRVTIEEIQKKTAEFYKLDLRELYSARRARRVARPRQVAMFLARELTSRSLPDIGRRFGGRDHTTVLHACRRIEALCKTDPVFQQEVDFLRKVLGRASRN
ncbi:MAG: chromosomal replication initiator protein DnaA [Alphaproteobacteria bacterium]|nr:chromosomal replication initiator protein DnaA [Alphaproteobacteria bacterium]